ncbi:MAG: sensor histidine kinase [Oscillospiraceae bacterium]
MKHKMLVFRRYLPWLLLLLGVDGLAALFLWLADAEAFRVLVTVILLTTVLLFAAVLLVTDNLDQKKVRAFQAFLNNPDTCHEEELLKAVSASEADAVRLLGTALREKQLACSRVEAELADYEEYVEAWAHETKTPLSLLTLILDNRRDEMPGAVSFKLDYVRNRMQEAVNQMLYYARLKGTQKDYLFEYVAIRSCIEDVLEDYRPLLEEKNFRISNQVQDVLVYTDRRGIQFLLGQVVSNAVKYSAGSPELAIALEQSAGTDVLRIRDNGIGVKSCDLPYIFEKGFTGDSVDKRKKATGMGLYLSKKMADNLNIRLDVHSEWGKGFEMLISFPSVNREDP